ncbi:carbohydrate-binding family 9-like protein [Sphaerochaeta sp. PS]|uniref:carbohydrate-binding family 9-like protein n=1 Tax=Sphaerochaeta sp. PS TaxID=3076336 RepID=UPI0028A30821|nr:carbohydrate-binding family 9-like protein [Sphaerochaeta sp. PS]MDT4762034.1 carbohydrate-binding family 9-like protein [Sphaerochaeta sp. PS]
MDETLVIRVTQGEMERSLPLPLQACWDDAEGVEASVRLSHDGRHLFVRFSIQEPQLRRMCTEHNQKVHTDSCMEIFLQREGSAEYVNFEFSATTKALVGRGEGRANRTLYPTFTIEEIPLSFELLENNNVQSRYRLDVSIDLVLFGLMQEGESLSSLRLKGNIYKCGDGLKKPHYLCYGPIGTVKPDFHTPEYFVPFRFL